MRYIEQDLQGDFNCDRFVHQFVLGPEFAHALKGWQQVSIDESFKLTAHPALNIVQVTDRDKSITIIGHILDPGHPEATNTEVAGYLLDEFTTLDQLLFATNELGGRWVLVARDDEHVFLFNDALGLRQVFFTTPDFSEGVWAVSQPGLLAWLFKLKVDDEAIKFLDSHVIRNYREYRWPGNVTPFGEIRHLLPNRYLDLRTGQTRRFWPKEPIGKLSLGQGVDNAVKLLEGLMAAAYERFDLVLGMTAGLDSRVVLAASRKNSKKIRAVTVRQGRMPDNHQDLAVAARLLCKLEIPHCIVKTLPYMSGAFSKAFKENVFLAHDHYGPDAEAILHEFSREKVVATGSGAEVARASFRARIDASKSEYSAEELARLLFMEGNEFAVRAYAQWLDEIGDLHDVHLLDLLSWENLHGNWLAGTQMEFDYAWRDIVTPFNCRALLVNLLSIDEKYRSAPDYRAFKMLIEKMWSELLDESINPDKNKQKHTPGRIRWRNSKERAKRYLSRIGLS